jgi:hypothetical protein
VLWVAQALAELGQDAFLAGDVETAKRLLLESADLGGDALLFTAQGMLAQAELSLRCNRAELALEQLLALQQRASKQRVLIVDSERVKGETLAALGQVNAAEDSLQRARDEAEALAIRPVHWRACLGLARLFEHQGRTDEAASERAAALRALEAVAESLSDDGLRRAFARSEPMQDARRATRIG